MNNNYYWSLIAASKKKLPPIWVEYIVARAIDFSLPAYDTIQENIVADTDHLASIQLYDANMALTANLRPCLSTEKGHYLEGCLYDVVKKKFYYSQNAGVKYGDIIREVKYIDSTGTQHLSINTNNTYVITGLSFMVSKYGSGNDIAECNGQILYTPSNGRYRMYNGTQSSYSKIVVENIKEDVIFYNKSIFFNNYNHVVPQNKYNNITICAASGLTGHSYIKVLSLYVKNTSSVYILDTIPCILSDGTVCMWDWISGEAKKNAGTGEFVAGEDVNDLFNIVEKEGVFLNRETGDGLNVKDKSLAHITSLKGNTLVWNQMIKNGDFKDVMSDFATDNATIHRVENGIQIIQGSNKYGGFLYIRFNYTDHKYYISTICYSGNDLVRCGISFLNNQSISTNPVAYNNYNTVFERCSTVGYLNRNANHLALSVGDSSTAGKSFFGIFKTFVCIDLTEMFGAGNEPETAEEFEAMFPADYYDYDAGSLLNVDAGGMKSTDVEKAKWDSLYFVDDTHTLSSLTGKTEGSSVSDVIFPDGMKRVGDVYDELTDVKDGCFTKAVKRIGVRAYQTGDEDDTTLKTDGTNTYYALSNAIVYTLDTPVSCNYKVWKGGSEIVAPENTEALTAPVDMSVKYIVEADE